MGIEQVKSRIQKDLENKKKELQKEIIAEKEKIDNLAKEEISRYMDKIAREEEDIITNLEIREIASTNLEVKKKILESRKGIMDSVYSDVKKKIAEYPKNKRAEILKKLLIKANKEIKVFYVGVNKSDLSLINGYDVEEENISGGMICENKEKTLRVDYSYEKILEELKEENLGKISSLLFP